MPSRSDNRKTLNRLFQGYLKDYGDDAGWQIVRVIIEELGGLRMTVPKDKNRTDENMTYICLLYDRLIEEFGRASAMAVIRKMVTHLGGLRITIPTVEYLYREERNRKIQERYNGGNIKELALLWGMSPTGVRKVLKED